MLEVVRIAIVLLAACGRIGFTGGVDSETIDASPGADGGVIDGRPLDDAGQGDPQGRFVWTTVKFAGELAPRSRTDESDGVRGETWIQGTQLVHRSASLQSGAPIDFATTSHQLAISGAAWHVTSPTSAITMTATWADPDHVTLVWDDTAPGTVGTAGTTAGAEIDSPAGLEASSGCGDDADAARPVGTFAARASTASRIAASSSCVARSSFSAAL